MVWKKSQRASGAHQHCILCCFLLYHNLPLSTPLFGKTDNAQSERKRGGLCLNFCSAGCRAIVFVGQEERITSPPFSFLLPSPFFFFPFGICSSLFVRSRGILLHMESSACSSLRLPTLVFALCSRQANLDQNFPPCQRPHTHTRTHTHTHTHTPHAQIKGKRGFTNTARKNKNQKLLLGVCCVCLPLPPTFSKSTTPTTA